MKTKDARHGAGLVNGRVRDGKERSRSAGQELRLSGPHTFRVHTLPLRSRKESDGARKDRSP